MGNCKDEIARVNHEFMDAFHTGTASWIAKLYAADALLMPPGADAIRGEEGISAFWQSAIDAGITEAKLESDSVDQYADDVAVEIGRYTLLKKDEVADKGKYIVVWKRKDEEWRLLRDIWNSNPLPTAT